MIKLRVKSEQLGDLLVFWLCEGPEVRQVEKHGHTIKTAIALSHTDQINCCLTYCMYRIFTNIFKHAWIYKFCHCWKNSFHRDLLMKSYLLCLKGKSKRDMPNLTTICKHGTKIITRTFSTLRFDEIPSLAGCIV